MIDTLTIEKRILQIVFDTAVHSLDFGSGFLDDEEVAALREIAVILSVDPAKATPSNFTCKYGLERHETHPTTPNAKVCWRCRQTIP
jgi:hypothetical protein